MYRQALEFSLGALAAPVPARPVAADGVGSRKQRAPRPRSKPRATRSRRAGAQALVAGRRMLLLATRTATPLWAAGRAEATRTRHQSSAGLSGLRFCLGCPRESPGARHSQGGTGGGRGLRSQMGWLLGCCARTSTGFAPASPLWGCLGTSASRARAPKGSASEKHTAARSSAEAGSQGESRRQAHGACEGRGRRAWVASAGPAASAAPTGPGHGYLGGWARRAAEPLCSQATARSALRAAWQGLGRSPRPRSRRWWRTRTAGQGLRPLPGQQPSNT